MKRKRRAVGRTETTVQAFALLPFLLTARPPVVAAVQCPDGTPPPCAGRPAARPAVRPAPPPIDRNRIAVLPFRVTTADTMLGEGIAELLASEFTGESGPRAVHMGTVLRAWRQAGGRAGAPLPPDEAVRAGRSMGAGLVVDGSVVGIGSRLTISASVMTVPDGRSRRATPISGPADSLDVLLRRFSTALLAVAGGEPRAVARGTLTESPAAMRAYLEGLAHWRRYSVQVAARAFERAFAEDTLFARAAFMRMVVASWGATNLQQWVRTVWEIRDRLSLPDRQLLAAYLGEAYPAPRTPAQHLADRQQAADRLPESPEAHYILGDWLYHHGAAANQGDRLIRALSHFHRSLALDTQETVLAHLTEAAAIAGDTAVLARLRSALEAAGPSLWSANWLAAGLLRDDEWLARLRQRPNAGGAFAIALIGLVGLPDSLADEAIDTVESRSGGVLAQARQLRFYLALMRGRPARAESVATLLPADGPALAIRMVAMLFADGDSAAARQAAARLASLNRNRADLICADALWRIEHGQPAEWNDTLLRRGGGQSCAALLVMERARRADAAEFPALLAAADSVTRMQMGNGQSYAGFENLLLARAWEARGDVRRALDAIRLRPHAISVVWSEITGARVEGRLAALVGDTAGALRAYRHYLQLRHTPEAILVPQRDSVAAALARLERR